MDILIEPSVKRLNHWIQIANEKFSALPKEFWEHRRRPDSWSNKEILGHLIDSATNNHHRFVRAQFEQMPSIAYDQNQWNVCGHYQDIGINQLIEFWTAYNRQLLELIKRIPGPALLNMVKVRDNEYDLRFLIQDYVDHLEHHLNQLISLD